jgi:hypothetical protein
MNTPTIQPGPARDTLGAMSEAKGERVQGPASYFPSIEEKYGRPIEEWQRMIRASELTKHMDLVNWLKTDHGMGHGHANALVAYTLAEPPGAGSP